MVDEAEAAEDWPRRRHFASRCHADHPGSRRSRPALLCDHDRSHITESRMRFVSVRELKANPSAFLRVAGRGEMVVVASCGRPTAVLRPITGEEIEDYILENSPRIKRMVAEGDRDRRAGRVTPLEK